MEYYKNCVVGDDYKGFKEVYKLLLDNKKVLWIDSSNFVERLSEKVIYDIAIELVDEFLRKDTTLQSKTLSSSLTLVDKDGKKLKNVKSNQKNNGINDFLDYVLDCQLSLLSQINNYTKRSKLVYYQGEPEFARDKEVGVHVDGAGQFLFKFSKCKFLPQKNLYLKQDYIKSSNGFVAKEMFFDNFKKSYKYLWITDNQKDVNFLAKLSSLGLKISVVTGIDFNLKLNMPESSGKNSKNLSIIKASQVQALDDTKLKIKTVKELVSNKKFKPKKVSETKSKDQEFTYSKVVFSHQEITDYNYYSYNIGLYYAGVELFL